MIGDDSPPGPRHRPADGRRAQMIKGVLELALLCILRGRAHYGLEILSQMNAGAGLDVADGTIYPLLHRMEAAGFVAAEWRLDDGQARPRKYYALTANGIAELHRLSNEWRDLRDRIDALLQKGSS